MGVKIQRDYSPKLFQKFSTTWRALANGKFTTFDLGSLTDKRSSKITVLGLHSEVRGLESYLNQNKFEQTFDVTCAPGEAIFGPEIDYTLGSFSCHVVSSGFKQINFTDSELVLELTLNDASAVTYLTPLVTPSLSPIIYGYNFERKLDDNVDLQLNYVSGGNVVGRNNNVRTFKCRVQLTNEEWTSVKIHILNSRALVMSLPDLYTEPFGSQVSGPYNVKLLKWSETRSGLTFWNVNLEFALNDID